MVTTHSPSSVGIVRERDALLSTKIAIPRIRPDRLTRSRLIETLDQALDRELILVCSPAGFGKTTLLADWAAAANVPVAWLSLDPDDDDPARFWRYVIAALDRVCVGLEDRLLPLPTGPGADHGVVTALINQIEGQAGDIVLVLDDYHVVKSPLIHDGVALLVSRIPRRLHVVIATRSDPPLPLARFRVQGRLAELRDTDLRFTSAESDGLLRQVWQLDLSPEVVAVLEAKTEGWAVGLQLAALSLRERSDPDALLDAFTGTHRYVLDYLTDEVLERQPERVRAFLLHNSVLDRMTAPLCNAVTGDADGQEMLEWIERINLFVVPLDEHRRWYRFHHLFAEALRAHLQRVAAEQVAELHRRAAQWCEHNGLIDEAIRHAIGAQDPAWAARLVEEHLNETLQRGETALLGKWMALLPDDAVRSQPGLLLARGMQCLHGGHLQAVEECLDYADRAFGGEAGRQVLHLPTDGGLVADVRAAVALQRADLAVMRGDVGAVFSLAGAALELTSADERGPRLWARLLRASAHWMDGRLADAESAFMEVLAEARTAPEAYPMMATCFPLGRVRHSRGNLAAALRTYQDGLRFATENRTVPNQYHAAESHLGMAHVFYERDDLDRAREHVTAGLEFGRQVVDVTTPLHGLVTLAWIHQAHGEHEPALAAMDEACRLRSSPDVIAMWNPAPSERARLMVVQGRIDEATRWIEARGLGPDDALSYPTERDYLVLARVLVAQGAQEQALHLLDKLHRLADPQGRVHSLIQIRTLRALTMQAAGQHSDATAELAEALALARPLGFIRTFADEGAPMAALLRRLLNTQLRSSTGPTATQLRHQVTRIQRAMKVSTGAQQPAVPVAGLVDELTRRELEVLQLIAAGRHNREIAQDLFVTIDTVKKHASHILAKLDATSRTHAAARARELGLIS
ncbi:MAG TPA: LuxR C-terminal-related transcriptional regulator [Gemmatimonadaceae bacterium]